jgi:solute carrier family 13 (sodium-dependent dicarboxylate transporter), member 2/3/5
MTDGREQQTFWSTWGAAKQLAKLALGIAGALIVYTVLPSDSDDLTAAARATAAIGVLMAIWWMSEALPLAVTALVPIVLLPLANVVSIGEATAPYASDVIFLFMGGFMLALAMERSGLHRRIALRIVLIVGVYPTRLVGGFMLATAFLSMWISNTAATVMMLPIGVSIILLLDSSISPDKDEADEELSMEEVHPDTRSFATGLMLGIAYAASIGSIATPIGTPPNLFMIGFLESSYDIEIGFGQWMAFGLPLALVFLPIAWLLLTRVLYRPAFSDIEGGRELIQGEVAELGPVSRNERLVMIIFGGAAVAWILRDPISSWDWLVERLPWVANLSDAGIAIAAAILLFAIPYDLKTGETSLDWETAKGLPWQVLLLFGGGLSLATAVQTSGLDLWIGEQLDALAALPILLLILGITAVVVGLTELTSNTATAATFLPILGGLAVVNGIDPLILVVPAALAGTCAFMLPVATPPNAIVFGSGHVTIGQMVRAGIVLNLIAVLLIALAMYLLAPWTLGIDTSELFAR